MLTNEADVVATMTQVLQSMSAAQIFWVIALLIAVDVAVGVFQAAVAKQLDPTMLAKTGNKVMGVLGSVGFAFLLLKLSTASVIVAMAHGIILSTIAGEALSIVKNYRMSCEALGTPIPYWVGFLTSFLGKFANDVPASTATPPPADPEPLTSVIPAAHAEPSPPASDVPNGG